MGFWLPLDLASPERGKSLQDAGIEILQDLFQLTGASPIDIIIEINNLGPFYYILVELNQSTYLFFL